MSHVQIGTYQFSAIRVHSCAVPRKRNLITTFCVTLIASAVAVSQAATPIKTSWRYYRPGNTGIQGDYNEAIWIGADNNPWIGGYDPLAEEGGVAKFIQGQNRWFNVSNIDYPVIGSANEVGYCRISDMVSDNANNLWMGTMRGALKMNLGVGPLSLQRFDASNSALPGGLIRDVSLAPDGSIWFSSEATAYGGGGLTRFNPTNSTWTHIDGHGGGPIAIQPKPSGGYYIWCTNPGFSDAERYDSSTGTWTSFSPTAGNPSHLSSKDSVDAQGNMWVMRWYGDQGQETLDCMRPDGTWVSPALPPLNPVVPVAFLRAFGNMQLLMVDGYMHLQRFNGSGWSDLGEIPHSGFIDDLDIDTAGNVWMVGLGTGGALKRSAATGFWQRYRITNTSQFDLFNNDLAVDSLTGNVFATANASPSVGGMVKFDGTRWTGYVTELGYGLTGDWPFSGSPQSEAVYVRPSNGKVVVNPINGFTHEYDGTVWSQILGGPDQIRQYMEDSMGRVWAIPHYGGLGYFQNGTFNDVGMSGWGTVIHRDVEQPGTVWAVSESELVRANGTTRISKTPADFPNVGDQFTGLAVQRKGTAWVGTWSIGTAEGSTLIRYSATRNAYEIWRHGPQWKFPGDHVRPRLATPDGRIWMTYDSEYPSTNLGLCWFDGTHVGSYPAPPDGAWRHGGLPGGIINDIEMKLIPGGYELWISCASRGIAVLKVLYQTP